MTTLNILINDSGSIHANIESYNAPDQYTEFTIDPNQPLKGTDWNPAAPVTDEYGDFITDEDFNAYQEALKVYLPLFLEDKVINSYRVNNLSFLSETEGNLVFNVEETLVMTVVKDALQPFRI